MASARRTFLVVDRSAYRLRVYRRGVLKPKWHKVKTYPIAVGDIGYATPGGMWEINWKALDPDWTMPHSDWVAEKDRGKVIPGGDPRNPLIAAFISIAEGEGVGFHGTKNLGSLGSRASHGCIRMKPEHVLELYKMVKKGTPVYIV